MDSNQNKSPKLLLIDGFALAFRAFYAMPTTMTDDKGTPLNAIFGFISMVFNAIDQLKPDYFAVCFDHKDPNFREDIYPDYKAHRSDPPDEFKVQVPLLFEAVDNMGFLRIDKSGYEADDLLGAIAIEFSKKDMDVAIMTSDQDMLQIVTDQINIAMPVRGSSSLKLFGPEDVQEKYGFSPPLMIDYKALKGDSSDNIPGVKGVGDKTAVKLLTAYENLDGIYDHIDDITPKGVQEKLRKDKDNAYLSYQLATLKTDIPLEHAVDEFKYAPDWEKITAVCQHYKFNSLLRRFNLHASFTNVSDPKEEDIPANIETLGSYQCIDDLETLKQLLPLLKRGFAIDLETTSLSVHDAQIVGVAISSNAKKGYYIPLNKYLDLKPLEKSDEIIPLFEIEKQDVVAIDFKISPALTALKPLLEDPDIPKYTHNGKYEINVFRNYDIQLNGIAFDTMIAAHLVYPLDSVGLKALANRHFGIEMTSYEAVAGKGKLQVGFHEIDIEEAAQYAAADADFTRRLTDLLKPKIEDSFSDLFYSIELPLQEILANMEYEGVCINEEYLKTLHDSFSKEIVALESEVYTLAGVSFNLGSPKQLSEVLFDKLGLPPGKKTKTGYSTDSSVLEKLAKEYEVAEKITRYRGFAKLLSTYVHALPKLVSLQSKKIHTSFNQTVTATGRLSSTNPNLQNIPIRTEEGIKIRRAFIPSHKDGQLLSIDYSQIELRILAHMTQDKGLVDAFQKGQDIHQSTAAMVFGVAYEAVSKDQRDRAKAINFGISYGQSAFALSEQLGIPRKEAAEIIDAYYTQFPTIKTFVSDTIAYAQEHGYVVTEFGRKRPIPDITATNRAQQAHAQRIAVNTRVQGTAADCMKIAMREVAKMMSENNCLSKMIIQVHDELVFDLHPDEIKTLPGQLAQVMSAAVNLSVPMTVDSAMGENWQEAG